MIGADAERAAREADESARKATENAAFIGSGPREIWRGEQQLRIDNHTARSADRKQLETNLAQGQRVDLTYGGLVYSFVANYFGGTGNDLV